MSLYKEKLIMIMFIADYCSYNSLHLYFCAAEIRGRCWGVSRQQRGRTAECRVLCTALQITDAEKKTAAVTEWVLFCFLEEPPLAGAKQQSDPLAARWIMSTELKAPIAAAHYDTTVLISSDLYCSLSLEFIWPKLKSAEFMKLSVIFPTNDDVHVQQ